MSVNSVKDFLEKTNALIEKGDERFMKQIDRMINQYIWKDYDSQFLVDLNEAKQR